MARSVLLARRDWVRHQDTVISGGAWTTPSSTLTDPRPQVVWQASSPEPEATTFTVDFGVARSVGLMQFQRLGVTSLATMRIRAGADPTFVTNVYDTGDVTGWPRDKQPFSTTPWGELTLNGVYEAEEFISLGMPRFFIPPTPIFVRYLRVQIFDPTAYVPAQIGCFGAYETWQPTYSDFGWTMTFIDETDVQTVPYGSRFFIPRGKRRRINIGLSFKEPEYLQIAVGWVAMTGKATPTVISIYPDDTLNVEKRALYGHLIEDVVIANPAYAFYQMPISVEQLI